MDENNMLQYVDHTLLKADATWAEVQTLCDEAMEHGTASVCINPCFVARAAQYLKDSPVKVCTVIGFPLGATTTAAKVCELKQALADGADEFDMVINIGDLKSGENETVKNEIAALKQAAGDKVLKVIIETCLLTDEQKATMCDLVCEAGADFIKTSTGFSTGGATFEDVALFKKHCAGRCEIKAAGGIRSVDDMRKFLELGATRLGTSSAIKLVAGEKTSGY